MVKGSPHSPLETPTPNGNPKAKLNFTEVGTLGRGQGDLLDRQRRSNPSSMALSGDEVPIIVFDHRCCICARNLPFLSIGKAERSGVLPSKAKRRRGMSMGLEGQTCTDGFGKTHIPLRRGTAARSEGEAAQGDVGGVNKAPRYPHQHPPPSLALGHPLRRQCHQLKRLSRLSLRTK